jgi:hypothetical protein
VGSKVSEEDEESPLLEAVTRERLVKLQQTEKTYHALWRFVKCGDER